MSPLRSNRPTGRAKRSEEEAGPANLSLCRISSTETGAKKRETPRRYLGVLSAGAISSRGISGHRISSQSHIGFREFPEL
ncbi:hypothetical protein K0M31_012689 [Melipona bicolor]|uniref:Uncharacterized protein n=1 Tax=Melipona bicolor TaxID=60889 RepID=A0AA40FJW9_9HYME|nr:hypothetical protein K0M31_012689 [Melipona bicolor]